jgi:ABC-type multidrug transport system fused ATPase/permease subunit
MADSLLADLRRCVGLLTPGECWRWAGLVPVALATAGIEALSAAAIFALVQVVHDPRAATVGPIVARIQGFMPGHDARAVALVMVALLSALYVARGLLLAAASYYRHTVASVSATRLSRRMLATYLAAPYAFHLHHDSARLIRRTTGAVDVAVRTFLLSAVGLATEILVVAGIVAILATTTPPATVLVVAAALGLALLGARLVRPLLSRWGREQQQMMEGVYRSLQQSLGGVKEVKATGGERFFEAAFAERQGTFWRLRRRESVLTDGLRLAMESICVVGLLLMVVVLTLARGTGVDSIAVLGVYAYAGFRIIPAVNRTMLCLHLMSSGRAAVRDLHEDLAALAPATAVPAGAQRDVPFARAIAFERVSYTYGDQRRFVLRDVDLIIRHGESIGLVGRSGAGKSTLVDLLLGLLEPTSGRVSVDGIDIREGLRSWQARIGYVPQTPFLTEDTLRRNIAFGVEDGRIDERRIWAAVHQARLDELAASLPHGLETRVGERGVRLSGGQRQRVAVARALYRDPEVVVLDEATSALDLQTEREVGDAIEALQGTRTLIVIAHRLSTVRRCDRLVFMSEGRIEGVGVFDELLARHAEFRAIADAG